MDLNPFTKAAADNETLNAYHVDIVVKHNLERREVSITSWSLDGFRLAGSDLFDLLDRLPGEIATWFHRRHDIEVAVIPVYSTFDPKSRGINDGYVVIPIRSMVAAVRGMEPKR